MRSNTGVEGESYLSVTRSSLSEEEELDGLDKFAGTFVVKAISTEASVNGKILPWEEWDSWRGDWRLCLRAFWEGPEFSIFERIHAFAEVILLVIYIITLSYWLQEKMSPQKEMT